MAKNKVRLIFLVIKFEIYLKYHLEIAENIKSIFDEPASTGRQKIMPLPEIGENDLEELIEYCKKNKLTLRFFD